MLFKLEGVALLVADPPRCSSTTRRNVSIKLQKWSYKCICTVIFVEQNYDPFLVNFVKAPQPVLQASLDAHQSFLQVKQRPCQDGSSE